MWSQIYRGTVGSPDAGPWVPELGSACSLFSLAIAGPESRRPGPRPLTPDPPLSPRGAVTVDPDLDSAVSESEPERPLRPLKGFHFCPATVCGMGSGAT